MKKTALLIFFLAGTIFHSFADEIVCDTILCNGYRVLLAVPEFSNKRITMEYYDEGYLKLYSIDKKSNAVVMIQCGCSLCKVREEIDTIIYNYSIGNIASTKLYIHDDLYFRVDNYLEKNIIIRYMFVPKDLLSFANNILDNVIILNNNIIP